MESREDSPRSASRQTRPLPVWARLLRAVGCAALLTLLLARPAQAVTYLEQIERLRLINAFLLDYRPGQAPLVPAEPVLDLSVEIIPNPSIDNRVGAKDEPNNAPPAIPRVRGRYLLPSGWMVGGTASPPVEVLKYSALWLGAEGAYRQALGPVHAELRVFAITGEVKGPITEPGAKDVFRFANRGGDLRAGLPFGDWSAYAGLGAGTTHTELEIDADGAFIEGDNGYRYWLAGAGWARGSWLFTVEQNFTDTFLSHLILAASYRW